MIKIILPIAMVGILSACAEVAKSVMLPNGNQGFYLSCENGNADWTDCYASATQACGGRYTIVDKNETSTSTPYGPLVKRGMFVECKK
jgi:hypothetical protein